MCIYIYNLFVYIYIYKQINFRDSKLPGIALRSDLYTTPGL